MPGNRRQLLLTTETVAGLRFPPLTQIPAGCAGVIQQDIRKLVQQSAQRQNSVDHGTSPLAADLHEFVAAASQGRGQGQGGANLRECCLADSGSNTIPGGYFYFPDKTEFQSAVKIKAAQAWMQTELHNCGLFLQLCNRHQPQLALRADFFAAFPADFFADFAAALPALFCAAFPEVFFADFFAGWPPSNTRSQPLTNFLELPVWTVYPVISAIFLRRTWSCKQK